MLYGDWTDFTCRLPGSGLGR